MKAIKVFVAAMVMAAAIPALSAEKVDIGKREYGQSCATCHGLDGKGKGSFAQALELSMPDLTTMAIRNGGVFPVLRVYSVIDGREVVKAHGTREMPIWGRHYSVGSAHEYDDYPHNQEIAARGRILLLIDYLYRLQSK